DTALCFAAQGHRVTGIDFLEEPIRRARRKAAERGLSVEFLVKDALTLSEWSGRFTSVIDSGLFHVLSDDRRRYVHGLGHCVITGRVRWTFSSPSCEPLWPRGSPTSSRVAYRCPPLPRPP